MWLFVPKKIYPVREMNVRTIESLMQCCLDNPEFKGVMVFEQYINMLDYAIKLKYNIQENKAESVASVDIVTDCDYENDMHIKMNHFLLRFANGSNIILIFFLPDLLEGLCVNEALYESKVPPTVLTKILKFDEYSNMEQSEQIDQFLECFLISGDKKNE